eukprot:TRINITY_DN2595_c1_g1_i1.p1 TRINITY_DN2595_c1_g1~~TRINITY_DN2595_c1_g1_i1.p1  ORF type:complete len:1100 (+),score=276.63 TRINITY_DN2595_c1_g1_i1:98-3301(+)
MALPAIARSPSDRGNEYILLSAQELAELKRTRRYLPESAPQEADVPDLSNDAVFDRMLASAERDGIRAAYYHLVLGLLLQAVQAGLHPRQRIGVLCSALNTVGFSSDMYREPRLTPRGVAVAVALVWDCGGQLDQTEGRHTVRLKLRLEAAISKSFDAAQLRASRSIRLANTSSINLAVTARTGQDGETEAPPTPLFDGTQREQQHRTALLAQSAEQTVGHTPKVHLAAMYIQDALEFQPKRTYRETPHALRAHRKRLMLHYVVWADIIGLVVLSFISEPYWCRETDRCGKTDLYPRWSIDVISHPAEMAWEGVALLVLLYDYYLWVVVLGWNEVKGWRVRMMHGTLLLANVVDFFVALSQGTISFRLAAYLRIGYCVVYSNTLQRQFNFFFRAMPEFGKILTLLCAYVLCYAWFAVVFFPNDQPEGQKYFHELGEAMFNLMDLLTTNNFPDVMMPAYTQNRFYVFFFVFYVFFGLWMLVNLFIALVNQAFCESAERERVEMLRNQTECIVEAYRLLAGEGDGEGNIDRNLMLAVFAELNNNSSVRYIPTTEANILFGLLDNSGDCRIDLEEFRYLPFMMSLEFDEKSLRDHGWLPTYFPGVEKFAAWHTLKDVVRSRKFDLAVDVILLMNAVLVVVETRKYLTGEVQTQSDIDAQRRGWQAGLDFLFSVLYLIEMMLKIVVDGWNYYWGSLRNMFDGLVTLLALFSCVYILVPNGYNNTEMLRWFVMARLCRIVRLIGGVPHFEVIFGTLVLILPDVRKVMMMLFCIMYAFSCLGCDLFGGKMNRDPASHYYHALVDGNTTYAQSGWWPMNFNDMGSGMVMLFGCLVMNSWDNYVAAYVTVTSKWARIYFIAFWVVGYIACFNIVISAILNKFDERSKRYTRTDHKARSGWRVVAEKTGDLMCTFGVVLRDTLDGVAVVAEVLPGGPARAEGVREGSVLVQVNKATVSSVKEAEDALSAAQGEVEAFFEVEVHIGDDGWGHFNAQRITQTVTGESGEREFRVRYTGDEALLRYAAEDEGGGLLPGGGMDAVGFIRHLFTPHAPRATPASPTPASQSSAAGTASVVV